jgi:DNA-binding protein WhiA
MSFSGEVKEELATKIPPARHCQLAELAALMHYCGQLGQLPDGNLMIGFQTERESVVRKGFALLKRTFGISEESAADAGAIQSFLGKIGNPELPVDRSFIKSSCCQRAFLRGAFLAVGSISDPHKGYHLEFVCPTEAKAEQLRDVMAGFDLESRIVLRKKYHVVYLKEGEAIVDLLNVLGAPVSLMELENTRIYKEVNNSVNRRVNCEMSNIRKTVNAATRQIEDIEFLRDNYGLERLSPTLQEMASVRLEYPEMPLGELGQYLDPPVGKSGVNHRLRKLSELAEKVRLG